MVRTLGTQTDARSVSQPEPPLLGLLCRHLEPLPPPDPLDALRVHRPAGIAEQRRDAPIATAPALHGKRDDGGGQRVVIRSAPRRLPVRRAMLPQSPTGETLRDLEPLPDVLEARQRAGRETVSRSVRRSLTPAGSASRASDRTWPSAAAPSPSGLNRWRHDGSILSEILQPPHLVGLQAAELLAPAVIGERRHTDRADRLGHRLALRHQHVDPARSLATISSGLCFFWGILRPPTGPRAYFREDHLSGGRSHAGPCG